MHPQSCESGSLISVTHYFAANHCRVFSHSTPLYNKATQKNLSAATANQSRTCRGSNLKRNAPVRGVFRTGSTRNKMTTKQEAVKLHAPRIASRTYESTVGVIHQLRVGRCEAPYERYHFTVCRSRVLVHTVATGLRNALEQHVLNSACSARRLEPMEGKQVSLLKKRCSALHRKIKKKYLNAFDKRKSARDACDKSSPLYI